MPAKSSLKDRDRKYRLLFQENPQPMWVFESGSLRVLESNAAATVLYGFTASEFRGMTLADIYGPEGVRDLVAWLQEGDRGAIRSWRHCTKGGRLIDVEMSVHEIDYAGRKAQLAILIDITGRRELEDQLRQAQKMEAVGLLAGGVAHDFNNLLTIITGYSQLILNSLGAEDLNRHSAEQILKAGERAAALTRQLLAFSRRQVLQPRVLDLNRLVAGLSTMLQRLIGEDIDLRLSLGTDLGRVHADPGQMEQVLMNLVVNARDAMPRGGELTVVTERENGVVRAEVCDTGVGIAPDHLTKIFDPFFTTKAKSRGTGLGLAVTYGIIREHSGNVVVESQPGRGSTFRLEFPALRKTVHAV
jgi:two-component system, cell cycle sensor histidine kinase and response regulator CckA